MARKQEDEAKQDNIKEVEETEETVEEEETESSSLNDEETQDIIEEVEEDHLEFLHDGNNMSFYQANKAYYEDRNYEEAIAEFQAAIEYEKSHPSDPPNAEESEDSEDPTEPPPPNDILAKSMYWMGEAYLKLNQINQALETFGQLSKHHSLHYLAPAAQRRIASLTLDKESGSA
ncbi:tetratricopeptide repeat protein [Candidatus Poribacteria bacterium]|nr:tetratricopeptide repeat protein [Candidatus Poribacteria bacterium]